MVVQPNRKPPRSVANEHPLREEQVRSEIDLASHLVAPYYWEHIAHRVRELIGVRICRLFGLLRTEPLGKVVSYPRAIGQGRNTRSETGSAKTRLPKDGSSGLMVQQIVSACLTIGMSRETSRCPTRNWGPIGGKPAKRENQIRAIPRGLSRLVRPRHERCRRQALFF